MNDAQTQRLNDAMNVINALNVLNAMNDAMNVINAMRAHL